MNPQRFMQALPVRQQGLSLVELMIAMTIGLITVGAVLWMYTGVSRTHRVQDGIARMQEGARAIFEIMGNDLRMAGTTGCGYDKAKVANVLNTAAWYQPLFTQPIAGSEKDGTAGTTTQYSDVLSVLRADVSNEHIVQVHNAGTYTISTAANHGFTTGALLVVTDCTNVALFQASGVTPTNIVHAAAGTPGNSDADLGPGGGPFPFPNGSRIYPLSASTYFVKLNSAGVPSLYRRFPSGASATDTDEELVEGVQDFQVAFAVDTTATPDGSADYFDPDGDDDPYLTAAQVSAATTLGANAQERWQRVVSARISVLMVSEGNVAPSAQTYSFNGASVTATDLKLRKSFTHVVKLRNR